MLAKKNFFLTNFCHKSDIFKNYLWRKLKICVFGNSAKACTQKGAKKMYRTESGLVTDEQAKAIMLQNSAIWDKFWSIPHEKRTQSDWEELLKVQILVKE